MLFLFSFLFSFLSLVCLVAGFYFFDYSSVILEVFSPYWGFSDFSFIFCFDFVSFFFFSSVSLISSVVFLYSKFYMGDSVLVAYFLNSRFFYLLFLFVFSMMFLVFSGSWVLVMLGWDGLGLVSFLLVIFYGNASSLDSGLITFFTNRLGDCFFILSFIFLFYSGWFTLEFLSLSVTMFFSLVIVFGAITKSAQLPFSSWLPAAMAAPTPVSSLVHSSTLVTAGVFLMVRFNFLLEGVMLHLSYISLFTMFLAGLCANYELDFKKVVAMSTLSQLGFMLFSISLGYWLFGFLHMIFHAFFKSSLFLSTGNLMHYLFGDQDSRNFSALGVSFFSKTVFSVSSLSLMGFPFSLGFYSKDTILGDLLSFSFSFMGLVFFLSCVFTVSYSVRLLWMGFMGFAKFSGSLLFEESKFFYFPLLGLMLVSLFVGNFFLFYFIPPVFFSFLDLFLGVFIIFLGVLMIFFFPSFYVTLNYLYSISFLSLLSSSLLSSNSLVNFSYSYESSWGEIYGGGGFSMVVIFFYHWGLWLYKSKMLHILVFMGLIYSFVG